MNYKNNTLIEQFNKDYYPLEELKGSSDLCQINLYKTLMSNELFLNYYNKVKSLKTIIKAGFFTERQDEDLYINLFTTPFNKLNLIKNKTNYILLSTGGFAPIHIGHINMLEESKKHCENIGLHIAGGYISPSHDDYVLTKRNQSKDMHIYNRLEIANKELLDNDWIMVDPFEGLVCKSSINFTKVIERLEKYLHYHYKEYDIKVIYCYGIDNVNFSKVFEFNKVLSICVNRDSNVLDYSNKYTKYITNYKEITSSEIRKTFKLNVKKINSNLKYYLRDDLDYLNLNNVNNIRVKIYNIFNKYINNISMINIEKEIKFKEDNIISLDFYTKAKYNINYSREFNLCDNQIKSNKIINRIGFINKIEDINKDIEYILIDDDISTGKTINYIKDNILKDIKIKEIKTIIDYNLFYDVNDLRDFIIGSKSGGLSCILPNGMNIRVPYIFPYIDIYNRASIPYENIKDFSYDIIKLNIEIYKNKKISFFDNNFISFLEYQGYNKNDYINKYLNDLLIICSKD